MTLPIIQRFKNAKLAIEQIRRGEWVPKYNTLSEEHLHAERKGLSLWIGNGPWFCEVGSISQRGSQYFGLLWRHWVWWAAAGKLKRDADKAKRKVALVLPE